MKDTVASPSLDILQFRVDVLLRRPTWDEEFCGAFGSLAILRLVRRCYIAVNWLIK